jgi:hypothetical protein
MVQVCVKSIGRIFKGKTNAVAAGKVLVNGVLEENN